MPQDVPIQSAAAKEVVGSVEVPQEYVEGLKDVEDFSHLILVYHFHLAQQYSLLVTPFLDKKLHGVFSTRAALSRKWLKMVLSPILLIRACNGLL